MAHWACNLTWFFFSVLRLDTLLENIDGGGSPSTATSVPPSAWFRYLPTEGKFLRHEMKFVVSVHQWPIRRGSAWRTIPPSFSSAFSSDVSRPSSINHSGPVRLHRIGWHGVHHFWWLSYRGCPRMPWCPTATGFWRVTIPWWLPRTVLYIHTVRKDTECLVRCWWIWMICMYSTPYLRLSLPFTRFSAVPASDWCCSLISFGAPRRHGRPPATGQRDRDVGESASACWLSSRGCTEHGI